MRTKSVGTAVSALFVAPDAASRFATAAGGPDLPMERIYG
jgi:hypothetical protein